MVTSQFSVTNINMQAHEIVILFKRIDFSRQWDNKRVMSTQYDDFLVLPTWCKYLGRQQARVSFEIQKFK